MEDKELIDKWREEFEAINACKGYSRYADGDYVYTTLQDNWEGFLMAKRNMPVVELPEKIKFREDESIEAYSHRNSFNSVINSIEKSLSEAGIQYRIKD